MHYGTLWLHSAAMSFLGCIYLWRPPPEPTSQSLSQALSFSPPACWFTSYLFLEEVLAGRVLMYSEHWAGGSAFAKCHPLVFTEAEAESVRSGSSYEEKVTGQEPASLPPRAGFSWRSHNCGCIWTQVFTPSGT